MITINKSAFERTIRSLDEASEGFNVKGMTNDQVECMTRLLQAKSPEDIADISDEKVVEMFDYISVFADCMGDSTILDNLGYGEGKYVLNLRQLPSAKSRRVL